MEESRSKGSNLLLLGDHDALPEEVLQRTSAWVFGEIDKFTNLMDRLAISLGNKHLGGCTYVDTICELVLKRGGARGSALQGRALPKFKTSG